MAEIFVEDGMLVAFGIEMAEKCVLEADVFSVGALLVTGVDADIANEQIGQAIVVVIEEESSGGMSGQIKSRFVRDVFRCV